MSMLSSQCDTLRVAAYALEDEGVMPDCAKLMRDAADTIWQLRNDCVELRDERDRMLRAAEGLADTYRLRGRHYRDLYYDAAAENAKLRELATALYRCSATKPCKTCPLFDGNGGCMDEQRMQELGLEPS